MKPTFKDYLSIALALLAIFLCGYGLGFLFGERKGLRHAPPPPSRPAPTSSIANWEKTTLATLEKRIELTPAQRAMVQAEIATSAARVRSAREEALAIYQAELAALHQRLRPHLTTEQWEQLQTPPPNE